MSLEWFRKASLAERWVAIYQLGWVVATVVGALLIWVPMMSSRPGVWVPIVGMLLYFVPVIWGLMSLFRGRGIGLHVLVGIECLSVVSAVGTSIAMRAGALPYREWQDLVGWKWLFLGLQSLTILAMFHVIKQRKKAQKSPPAE